MCVAVANAYSDISRYYICQRDDGSLIRGDDASAVYDQALLLVGFFHIIEWVRATILLTVTLVGANMTPVWYYTAPPTMIYGFICLCYVHHAYASEDGKACREYQHTRA